MHFTDSLVSMDRAELDAFLLEPNRNRQDRVVVRLVTNDDPIATVDPDDPMVLTSDLTVTTAETGAWPTGLRLRADDWQPVPDLGGTVLACIDRAPIIVQFELGTTVIVVGSHHLFDERWIAAADNAEFAAWSLSGTPDPELASSLRSARIDEPAPHRPVPTLDAQWNTPDFAEIELGSTESRLSESFVRTAAHAGREVGPASYSALVDLSGETDGVGALLLRNLPIGQVPSTPAGPTAMTTKDRVSEFVLLTAARLLGQPVGYRPEHGGDIVQNLIPTRSDLTRQTSTSSAVDLGFHTETAFHHHRPRFLLLLCLRGDPGATTTLACIDDVLPALSLATRHTLTEPRFRTRADESFGGGAHATGGRPTPVLTGAWDHPTMTFDAELMVGVDADAANALAELRDAISHRHTSVVLEAGDLLVIDNFRCVHGRSQFTARFDGTDRWLQRTFVVTDLAPSAAERVGRIVSTRFAA